MIGHLLTWLQILGVMALALVVNMGPYVLLNGLALPGLSGKALTSILAVCVGTGLCLAIRRWVLRTDLPELLGPRQRLHARQWVFFVVLGLALPWATLALYWAVGLGQFQALQGTPVALGLAWALATAISPGVLEELAYRYVFYGYLKTKMSAVAACVLGGLLFGALHLNQVNSVQGGLLLMAAALAVTVLFTVLYETSGSVWAPAIVHSLWDTFLLKIGLVAVNAPDKLAEGHWAYLGFVVQDPRAWLTGGDFGLEAGAISIGVYLAAAAWVHLRRR
ncbi:MAG: CPBP family intramembrane glutamic endopeptidase [Limnohabitans sp.]